MNLTFSDLVIYSLLNFSVNIYIYMSFKTLNLHTRAWLKMSEVGFLRVGVKKLLYKFEKISIGAKNVQKCPKAIFPQKAQNFFLNYFPKKPTYVRRLSVERTEDDVSRSRTWKFGQTGVTEGVSAEQKPRSLFTLRSEHVVANATLKNLKYLRVRGYN